MGEVRAGIIGMGIGKPNAEAIAKNPRGRVVALCDLVEEKMEDFAESLPDPVECYTDYKEMCRSSELDDAECSAPLRHGMIIQAMLEAMLESGQSGEEIALERRD